MEYLLFV